MKWVPTCTGAYISDSGRYKIEVKPHTKPKEWHVYQLDDRNKDIGFRYSRDSAKKLAKHNEKVLENQEYYAGSISK